MPQYLLSVRYGGDVSEFRNYSGRKVAADVYPMADRADTATNLDGNASELSAHVLASSSAAIVSTESISGVDSATAKASEVERPSITVMDFGLNRAGAAVRAKRNEVNADAPVLNLLARVFGGKTDERAWRVGAVGEERVGAELAKLGGEWKVIHAVEVGNRGSDIDHVVIGPAGVFTLNTKRHPGGKAWVGERTLMVNGQKVQYLRNSRHEAQRAQRMLSAACDREVVVRAAIVFVDLETFTVKQSPPDVDVTTRKRLAGWLRSLPVTLTFDEVEQIHTVARLSTTWLTKTP